MTNRNLVIAGVLLFFSGMLFMAPALLGSGLDTYGTFFQLGFITELAGTLTLAVGLRVKS